jgi:hypothetical protein
MEETLCGGVGLVCVAIGSHWGYGLAGTSSQKLLVFNQKVATRPDAMSLGVWTGENIPDIAFHIQNILGLRIISTILNTAT